MCHVVRREDRLRVPTFNVVQHGSVNLTTVRLAVCCKGAMMQNKGKKLPFPEVSFSTGETKFVGGTETENLSPEVTDGDKAGASRESAHLGRDGPRPWLQVSLAPPCDPMVL